MIFEWDENKRISNLKKHGLDFAAAYQIFEDSGAIRLESQSQDYAEKRFMTIGFYRNRLCVAVVIHTDRSNKTRIISFRKAGKKEREAYHGNSAIHN